MLEHYGTDTEDDDYDDDDDLSDSQQMIKEMKAEAAYQEKKLIDQKRQDTELGKSELNLLSKSMSCKMCSLWIKFKTILFVCLFV